MHIKPVLEEFKPKFAIMTGICAGDKSKVKLGDIIVADRAYFPEPGKEKLGENDQPVHLFDTDTRHIDQDALQFLHGFEGWKQAVMQLPRPCSKRQQREWILNQLLDEATPRISDIDMAILEKQAPDWRKILYELQNGPNPYLTSERSLINKSRLKELKYGREEFPYRDPAESVRLIAPMASVNAVREDNPFQNFQVPVRKTAAIDMEGAAFYRAVDDFRGVVRPLLVKAVCDYADSDKDDSYHGYASQASAAYALCFIKEYVNSSRIPGVGKLSRKRTEVYYRIENLIQEYRKIFIGREEKLKQLNEFIDHNINGFLLITGRAGYGKSALLANWIDKKPNVVHHFFRKSYYDTDNVSKFYENLLNQLNEFYGITREHPHQEDLRTEIYETLCQGAKKDNPLIIVFDGLDEADSDFPTPFPSKLPDHVFVIASIRADKNETPNYSRGWTDFDQRIHIEALPESAIPIWLKKTGCPPLAELAENKDFVSRLVTITEGFPLFLDFLIDEMARNAQTAKEAQTILSLTPRKFNDYIEDQLRFLSREFKKDREARDFFSLLAIAHGPLSDDDILDITELETDLLALPWQVKRWFNVQRSGDASFYAFAHPLLANEFKKAKFLKKSVIAVKERLVSYCRDWQKHKSRYALRYLASHLYEEKNYESVFELARDTAFRQTQIDEMADEPNMSLQTLQTALKCAIETDDVKMMAEFAISHAQSVAGLRQETPLEAARNGNLERAWEIADLYEIGICIKWYLLLAWSLKGNARTVDSRRTLERLVEKEMTRFRKADDVEYLISNIFEIDKKLSLSLCRRLLYDYSKCKIGMQLIEKGNLADALEIRDIIEREEYRVKLLREIIKFRAYTDDFHSALKFVEMIEDQEERGLAFRDIIKAYISYGELDKALELTKMIQGWADKSQALCDIALAQAKSGDWEQSEKIFKEAYKRTKFIYLDELFPNKSFTDHEKA